MGIIIGSVTTVTFGSSSTDSHVTQVSWDINNNVQRAYVLGSWDPYPQAQISTPTETLNITVYSPGPSYSTLPTKICVDANKISATVSPVGCGAGSAGPSSTSWFVTSYNYSKGDARSPGTESWSMMNYIGTELPNYTLRGISEGSTTDGVLTGIVLNSTGTTTGTQGSVSAGQIGRSDVQTLGMVTSVGNSKSTVGAIGQGNCSMPYTPLYL